MAAMTSIPQKPPNRAVAILAYEGVQILDIAGPLQALTTANEEGATPRYDAVVVARRLGLVRTASGLEILARRIPPWRQIDTLMIPGGPGIEAARRDRPLLATLRRASASVRRFCTICTGAFIAAEAGILDGRRAVTHWRACDKFAEAFSAVHLERDPIYLRDGHIWSSAGVTAGIDLTLALIEADHGNALAARVARRLVVYLRRPGGQSQYSEMLALQSQPEGYGDLLARVGANPAADWRVETLAAAAGQSPRTFFRQFKLRIGRTPAEAVTLIRLERARTLLETTPLPVETIAGQSGFGSSETLRRLVQRQFGLAPGALRGRFEAAVT
jgi:transcriptional regulator GlxA family with amidase domain